MGRSAGVLALVLAVSGCSPPVTGASSSVGDCAASVRYDGAVYVENGISRSGAERLGRADLSSCEDVGLDPRGMYFEEDPEQVTVWSFRGYDPAQVLGVRVDGHVFRVLFAEPTPTAVERDLRRRLLHDDRR